MELIKIDLQNNKIPSNIVACIGEFDGIHLAHQKLIEEVEKISIEKNIPSSIITFDPHPDFVLNKNSDNTYITPLNEKIKFINDNYNIDYFIVINFTEQLSKLPFDEFYDLFLKTINTIVIGYDFRFGYKGLGNESNLKKLHDNVIVIEQIKLNNEKIGSKNIINSLLNGNIEDANKMLGRLYKISGIVSKGSQIGSKIGYPTANINIEENFCLLKKGVYAVRVRINNNKNYNNNCCYYLGICNYGYNPSFNKIIKPRLEVHIFNFNKDIYDEYIEVEFIENIREEKVFPSVDDFLNQLKKDCEYCNNKYGGIYETISCRSDG